MVAGGDMIPVVIPCPQAEIARAKTASIASIHLELLNLLMRCTALSFFSGAANLNVAVVRPLKLAFHYDQTLLPLP